MIVNSIKKSVNHGSLVIVITKRNEHIELLAKLIADKGLTMQALMMAYES
ncbi:MULTISPECIES: hypothetical protein [unclassified Colwellia]|nr:MULTISPECIES: hypothetical protein [unclassified Colwellia]MBA6254153.1 hypothetical protein [Colwellia sp. MB3u-55]MBA6397618.1 hypothetical protein [Colwellia sp. BRX10-4]